MSTHSIIHGPLLFGLDEARAARGWSLGLGILLIIAGTLAVFSTFSATLATVTVLGVLLLAGAVIQLIHAFRAGRWSGFFLNLLAGILYGVAGFYMVANPMVSALTLTLFLSMFFIVIGVFRIVAAMAVRHPSWGWTLANGIISVALGAMIWAQWPEASLWFIGLFVGIELMFSGWALVMLSMALRPLLVRP